MSILQAKEAFTAEKEGGPGRARAAKKSGRREWEIRGRNARPSFL